MNPQANQFFLLVANYFCYVMFYIHFVCSVSFSLSRLITSAFYVLVLHSSCLLIQNCCKVVYSGIPVSHFKWLWKEYVRKSNTRKVYYKVDEYLYREKRKLTVGYIFIVMMYISLDRFFLALFFQNYLLLNHVTTINQMELLNLCYC